MRTSPQSDRWEPRQHHGTGLPAALAFRTRVTAGNGRVLEVIDAQADLGQRAADLLQLGFDSGELLPLGADKAGVGSNRIAEALDALGQFGLKLAGHRLHETLAQIFQLVVKVTLSPPLLGGDDQQTDDGHGAAGQKSGKIKERTL